MNKIERRVLRPVTQIVLYIASERVQAIADFEAKLELNPLEALLLASHSDQFADTHVAEDVDMLLCSLCGCMTTKTDPDDCACGRETLLAAHALDDHDAGTLPTLAEGSVDIDSEGTDDPSAHRAKS
jgi:hypothetical protein